MGVSKQNWIMKNAATGAENPGKLQTHASNGKFYSDIEN